MSQRLSVTHIHIVKPKAQRACWEYDRPWVRGKNLEARKWIVTTGYILADWLMAQSRSIDLAIAVAGVPVAYGPQAHEIPMDNKVREFQSSTGGGASRLYAGDGARRR